MSTPVKGWSPNQRKVIEEALSSDDYKYRIKFGSTEHLSLLHLGYMYMTADKEYLRFPSPLHRLLISYKIHEIHKRPAVKDFSPFLESVISHMDWELIQNSDSRHSAEGVVYERQFQMEFNRATMRVVGTQQVCFPDVGYACGAKGYMDFYINGNLQWGVELARNCDGAELLEHVGRFSGRGKYRHIPLKAKRVLNFVTADHYQKNPLVVDELEWKVVYEANNFQSVRVVRLKGGIKEEKRVDVIQRVGGPRQSFGTIVEQPAGGSRSLHIEEGEGEGEED